ncbi:MAG: DUF3696 domain-containing protein [Rhodothermaceae bacterium]|nr:DUF3696 domain-containing protein [Bacteroidota bacterium]MXW15405.1 DUF3696 domain-containing protein [Rhodothermaceae bacterium]MXW33132.1 DUF3696 domain-containing protein [Rhodothermaceae bacterium]MXX95995.1 DUF3696 domain-containing protein [Rhodothermaceae bacterium]MXZ18787.1 DUF3696 domain-containing protein [Rhodothermaceae bacterium]
MVTQIELRFFKCFEVLKLPLRKLTLLSGTNASGKSTVLQAFSVVHQTMRDFEWSSRLILNGSAVRLGTVMDVIDQVHGRGEICITLTNDEVEKIQWVFEGDREEMSMALKEGVYSSGENITSKFDNEQPLHYLSPASLNDHALIDRLRRMTYLTAERLGPREYYPYDDPQLTSVVGSQGEYAVSVLHTGADKKVLEKLVDEAAPPTRLRQVEARLSSFFPGCRLTTNPVQHANAISVGIRMSQETGFLRPTNIGFGLTQVLPIVVAAMSARKGDLLLIENPEVHLHPSGQAQMGRFLAEVAAADIQVVIETHSDHILNGIRRAIRNNLLSHQDIALHFFRQRESDGGVDRPQVESPMLDPNGNVDYWPDGFFDQFDKDMQDFASF